jgi:hypothetical protein
MTLERVEWLLGSSGEQLTGKEVPVLQGGQKVVSGERFYRWYADPKAGGPGDYLIVSFEGGVVKETWYWEVPLS